MRLKRWMAALVLGLACATGFATGDTGADFASTAERIRGGAGEQRLILLGETHATREIPDLIEILVTAYAAEGAVLLGLEMPRSEHAATSRYLDSDGGSAARALLRATPFWTITGDQHDGRRSEDMLDLIEALRALRSDGRDVAILPYDVDRSFHRVNGDSRDQAMAERVRAAYAALPRGRLLVLSGNIHTMLQKPLWAPAQMPVPMGAHLHDLQPYSVRIDARSGHRWECVNGGCGTHPVMAPPEISEPPYHLQVLLPSFTIARLLGATSTR